MSIVSLKKVSIVGRIADKSEAVSALQAFGELHIVDLDGSKTDVENEKGIQLLSEDLKKALRYLESSPVRRKQVPYTNSLDVEEIVCSTLDNQAKKREFTDRFDALLEREKTLEPWGDFSLPPLEEMAGTRLWFYIVPLKHMAAVQDLEYPWVIVHQDHRRAWLVLINQEEPPADVLPVDRFHTGKLSLSEVKQQRQQAELDLEDLEVQRQRLTRYVHVLKRLRARVEDSSQYSTVMASSVDLDALFLLQGWIPETAINALEELAKKYALAVMQEEVGEGEQAPTLLKNPPALKGGEALVNFYQTPAYTAWDPSFILFFSFSLFFAMILSDAAYAAILLGVLAAFWPKMASLATLRSLRPLFLSIGLSSLFWGMLVGSYFGKPPPSIEPFASLHVLDVNDFDTMMALSIACGLIHIMLANIQQVILWWGRPKSFLHMGWIVVLAAGAAMGLAHKLQESWFIYTQGVGIFGLLLVFVGGGERKINGMTDVIVRCLQGLKAVTNITNIFGDVLSYLRLFALGLASASLALTFNELADNAFSSQSGLGLLFGLLILIVGHTLNLFLAIVSGVVHGLRLNFIEFYKWALDGEGQPFKVFRKREYSK